MLVYGDPQYNARLPELLLALRKRIELVHCSDLEELRPLLIQAGQLEQAVSDCCAELSGDAARCIAAAQKITDEAACAFCAAWTGTERSTASKPVREALAAMMQEVERLEAAGDAELIVKVPEGFEYYALYPELYCVSTLRWAAERSSALSKRALVIGIRSIGTTLSAVIAAVLETAGWQTRRFTVRPKGDAYRRKAEIDPEALRMAEWCLIADEGPGLSGSSMAAVAKALADAGVKRERIAFFPGHAGEPGPAASTEIRRCWASTARSVTPLSDLRWTDCSLADLLLAKLSERCPGEKWNRVEDLGGGRWRRLFWDTEADWPAITVSFERPKYRCTTASGLSVLWKFVGLGASTDRARSSAELALHQMAVRAKQNWTIAPLGLFRGFVALPWIHGQPLTRSEAGAPEFVEHLGRYVAQAAGPLLSVQERQTALLRLEEMLYWNTNEMLGEPAARRTRKLAEQARSWAAAQPPEASLSQIFGDGHLAPHEWIRDPQGRIFKTDCVGHDADHTMIGRQSVAWDIAGALSEWHLDSSAEACLIEAVQRAGLEIHRPFLFFHRLAYAAFRAGLTLMCANSSSTAPAEQARLLQAHAVCRGELEHLLAA